MVTKSPTATPGSNGLLNVVAWPKALARIPVPHPALAEQLWQPPDRLTLSTMVVFSISITSNFSFITLKIDILTFTILAPYEHLTINLQGLRYPWHC